MIEAGVIERIWRYPIKSTGGELLHRAEVEPRGFVGDRLFAVRDAQGKFGSGKNTRRFRRMPGLLQLRSRYADDVGEPELMDPRGEVVPDPSAYLRRYLGREDVEVAREKAISHFDQLHRLHPHLLPKAGQMRGRLTLARCRSGLPVHSGRGAARRARRPWAGARLPGRRARLVARPARRRRAAGGHPPAHRAPVRLAAVLPARQPPRTRPRLDRPAARERTPDGPRDARCLLRARGTTSRGGIRMIQQTTPEPPITLPDPTRPPRPAASSHASPAARSTT